DGVLIIGEGNLNPASSLSVVTPDAGGNGSIQVTGQVTVSGFRVNGVAQPVGKVNHPTVTGTGELWVEGDLTPYQQWAVDSGLESGEMAGDIDADKDGVKNIIEYAVGGNPKAFTAPVLTQVA